LTVGENIKSKLLTIYIFNDFFDANSYGFVL